jgi:hypothetical protein
MEFVAPPPQTMDSERGKPVSKMFKPWLPLNENFTGMDCPAAVLLTTGALFTGCRKPLKL